jgi:hypothetical protein
MPTDNPSRNPSDRMDLPFVGLATFARQPACPDWDRLDGLPSRHTGTGRIRSYLSRMR